MDKTSLDVIKLDEHYALHQDGAVAATPAGRPLCSPSLRLMELLVRDACDTQPDCLAARELLECQLDEAEPASATLRQALLVSLGQDPLVARKFPGQSPALPSRAPDFSQPWLEEDACPMFMQYGSLVEAFAKAVAYLLEHGLAEYPAVQQEYAHFSRAVAAVLEGLPPAVLAALARVQARHDAGVLLPLLLVTDSLAPSEYAGAAAVFRAGRPGISLGRYRRLRQDAWTVREFLRASPALQRPPLRQLIAQGEHYRQEFKSTLRCNLHTGKYDTAITHAALKSLAGFLNSGGGVLLLGVRDDGSIQGIAQDGFPNQDRFGLHLWQMVESGLGSGACPYVETRFEPCDGATVCVVTCKESPRPVFLHAKTGEDEFYIRVGGSSRKLGVRDALEYISLHFKGD